MVNEAGRFERQGTTLRITADGNLFLSEEVDAIAKSRMDLRRFPFERQQFVAVFGVLETDSSELVLKVNPATTGIWQDEYHQVHMPQWEEPSLFSSVVEYEPRFIDGHISESAAFKVGVNLRVASHDQNGRSELGDRLDSRSRYLFRLAYIACSILTMAYMYLTD